MNQCWCYIQLKSSNFVDLPSSTAGVVQHRIGRPGSSGVSVIWTITQFYSLSFRQENAKYIVLHNVLFPKTTKDTCWLPHSHRCVILWFALECQSKPNVQSKVWIESSSAEVPKDVCLFVPKFQLICWFPWLYMRISPWCSKQEVPSGTPQTSIRNKQSSLYWSK